jgi:hypothetical protein
MDLGSGIRDPGSGKNLFWIPDPGSRGQKGTGSRIRIRNTGNRIRIEIVADPQTLVMNLHRAMQKHESPERAVLSIICTQCCGSEM